LARKRVESCLKQCWLEGVRRQLIGTLSKGYRQRVGLADALVSDPPVLILDEPTSGLDPTQIIETRKLIADLGQSRTVLISTHILSEVEKTCTRAVVIARGKVLAQGRLADLCPPGQSLEKMFLDLVEEREAIGA
jgi:ABC-2 type transport system ATP-binding protein